VTGEIEWLLMQLAEAGVRYLVVGGVAVVLQGYLRTTADLDLVVDLEPRNLAVAVAVLERLGFHPRPPVALRAFADADERTRWIDEENLQVFSLWHPEMPGFEVDLFVKMPFVFDEAFARASVARLGNSDVTVASIDDLIAMKQEAGRPRDLEDIHALLALKKWNGK
jgi:predicted nucleotidyltransferase